MRLNLQQNKDCLFHVLARKLVEDVHLKTLHGGVGITMRGIREKYWIPKLRQLAKQAIRLYHGCKWFQPVAFANPLPRTLPQDRTEGNF